MPRAGPGVWHKQVPLKVSICAWGLLQNRLPTKGNLVRGDIIHHEAQLCVSGRSEVEIAHHTFFNCNIFSSLWQLVRNWIEISSVDTQHVIDHFIQFPHSSRGHKARSF